MKARSRLLLPAFLALAIAPDIDYLALWFFGKNFEPRITHSFLFCILTSAGVAWLLRRTSDASTRIRDLAALLLVACSHLLLDFLVGVHGLPLFWPLTSTTFSSPIGMLPSAGRLQLSNFYLWRNLFIEAGILLPFAMWIVTWRVSGIQSAAFKRSLWALPLWAFFIAWSLSLHR